MTNDELARQLEFLRDIGVDSLDVLPVKPDSRTMTARSTQPVRPIQTNGPTRPGGPAASSRPALTPPSIPSAPLAQSGGLDVIRAEIGDCQRCKLAPMRTNIVFGSGNPKAELVFVGEAPGFDEDQQGLPFVGRAGQLLTKIIESINMGRDDVYICNVLKCRPPDNRNPEPDEVASCNPFLRKQLALINPKIVCCLGTFAAQTVMRTTQPISKLRGRFYDLDGMRIIATFHPAYLLRSPDKKREVWEDMKQIRAELFRLRS